MAVYALTSHGQARFLAWLYPFADSTGKSWQILQALLCHVFGWVAGRIDLRAGCSRSISPLHLLTLFMRLLARSWGFIGLRDCHLYFMWYCTFAAFQIAAQIGKPFGRLLATGLVTTLSFQTMLNIGGNVTKALPLTGITLPFISHGGSSLFDNIFGGGVAACAFRKRIACTE